MLYKLKLGFDIVHRSTRFHFNSLVVSHVQPISFKEFKETSNYGGILSHTQKEKHEAIYYLDKFIAFPTKNTPYYRE